MNVRKDPKAIIREVRHASKSSRRTIFFLSLPIALHFP